jgi:membrane protein
MTRHQTLRLAGRTLSNAWRHRILGLSAEAAFWQLLSMPSLFLAGLAALGYFAEFGGAGTATRVEDNLLASFSRAFSGQVVDELIAPMVHQVLSSGRADVLSLSFLVALWAGSSATATFVNTITIAYGMRDERGAVRSRLLALGIYLGSIVVGIVVAPALVFGPDQLIDMFPASARKTAGDVINGLYWPVVVALLLAGLTSMYHLAPPRRLPWRRGLPGATLAMIVFVCGSAGLRLYIGFVVARSHAYGTLAAPIAALLFFFVLALGVLIGAELNAAIEQTWPTPVRRQAPAIRLARTAISPALAAANARRAAYRARPCSTPATGGGPNGAATANCEGGTEP